MTQWSPVSFFTSLLIAYSLSTHTHHTRTHTHTHTHTRTHTHIHTHTIPTFSKLFCWNSSQHQALLPSAVYRPPIFLVSLCTRLSLSLHPLLPFLATTPAKPTVDAQSPADLMNSNYGQRWPIWGRRPKVSRGLFRLRSGIPSSLYLRHPYTLHPTPPLRHVGPGLAITVSRSSKYDSPLSFHTIHVHCTISFSNRCHVTDYTTLHTSCHSHTIDCRLHWIKKTN